MVWIQGAEVGMCVEQSNESSNYMRVEEFIDFYGNPSSFALLIVQILKSKSHYTDSQSASLSWCQAPIWGPRPIFLSP
jgi:hypothetical protein